MSIQQNVVIHNSNIDITSVLSWNDCEQAVLLILISLNSCY